MSTDKPVIGITGDFIMVRDVMPAAAVYEVYTRAVNNGAGGLPWVIPPLGDELDFKSLVHELDGIVFTGSRSNIEPHHYGGGPEPKNNPTDPARDRTTLPLIPLILESGIPMLCICRGMQELNVALGGNLHQELHKVPDRNDHRAPDDAPPDVKFAPAHDIDIAPGGILAALAGTDHYKVNSVHGQGIDKVAPGLRVEATAKDGAVESVSVTGSKTFALGVQWHPEWSFADHPLYTAIWHAFGDACRAHASGRGVRN